jgi:hypothetical protein
MSQWVDVITPVQRDAKRQDHPRRRAFSCVNLVQLIRHLSDAGFPAGFFLRPAVRSAAETDTADSLFADFDWNAALERDHFRKLPLAGNLDLSALRPFEGCPPESPGRVGFAAGQFEIVRRSPIALDENAQPPSAIRRQATDTREPHSASAVSAIVKAILAETLRSIST